jgi:group I intron endonuclease
MQGIYKIINKLDNKYYVGSSINIERRWKAHLSSLKKNTHKNDKLQNAWNKYGEESFLFIVVKELPLATESELRKVEDDYLNETQKFPDNNYNCCYDSRGGKLSAHTIEKIRASCKRVVKSPEWLAKMAEANRRRYANGWTASPETRAKMAFRGKHSEETKKKIAASLLGRKRGPYKTSHAPI